jgi:hypothetical protein
MDIWVVVLTARQIDGEFVLVKMIEAFKEEQKANVLMNSLKNDYVDANGPKPIRLTTDYGDILCHCIASVMPVKIKE